MTKTDWTPIAIIAGVVLVIVYLNNNPAILQYSPPQNSPNAPTNIVVNVPPPVNEPAPNPAPSTDLRGIFQPYLVVYPDAPTACTFMGGTWHWEFGYVGCVGTAAPTTACGDAAMIAAIGQCAATGAQAVCNPNNAYCRYG